MIDDGAAAACLPRCVTSRSAGLSCRPASLAGASGIGRARAMPLAFVLPTWIEQTSRTRPSRQAFEDFRPEPAAADHQGVG
jgi:hypothetical protein